MNGQCSRTGCTETVLHWLSGRHCSVRCQALDVAPRRARRDVYGDDAFHADRAAYALATGSAP